MLKNRSSWLSWFVPGFLFSLLLFGGAQYLGREPNFTLQFDRVVPLTTSPDVLKRALHEVPLWARWFHTMGKVERVDITESPMAVPDQTPEKGALIRFLIDPKKGDHRKFFLFAEVIDYVPEKKLSLRLRDDRSGKLHKLFNQVIWELEVIPAEGKLPVRLHGSARATSNSFRARFWGRSAEKVLMNQVYFIDLIGLAEFSLTEQEQLQMAY